MKRIRFWLQIKRFSNRTKNRKVPNKKEKFLLKKKVEVFGTLI